MTVLDDWLNDYYLSEEGALAVRESVLAKPRVKYAVLDNFFKPAALERLVAQHQTLTFNEQIDRQAQGRWLPYDGAVVFAQPGIHVGHELFFDEEWHRYLAYITAATFTFPTATEVKLRWHKPNATGFWIHTDATIRQLVVICYFNHGWRAADGGLLQLWQAELPCGPATFTVDSPDPTKRLDFLTQWQRIRTSTPGGGFRPPGQRDLVLIDQIVPTYNRLFVCNYQDDPAYHSVTPSNGRERTGFVQWLGAKHGTTKS